jgi:hypothetical protein
LGTAIYFSVKITVLNNNNLGLCPVLKLRSKINHIIIREAIMCKEKMVVNTEFANFLNCVEQKSFVVYEGFIGWEDENIIRLYPGFDPNKYYEIEKSDILYVKEDYENKEGGVLVFVDESCKMKKIEEVSGDSLEKADDFGEELQFPTATAATSRSFDPRCPSLFQRYLQCNCDRQPFNFKCILLANQLRRCGFRV